MSKQRDDAYDRMVALLDEMQRELSGRYWDNDPHDRIERAAKLRGDLSQAIWDYRDGCAEQWR